MAEPLLETAGLSKRYGTRQALADIDLQLAPGEVLGVLGPNGSGKSTLLRLILGFLRPTRGSATVAGYDCWQESLHVRRRVSYLPGELRLYDRMTGRQVVTFLAQLRGETPGPEVESLARTLDIDLDRRLTELSSGMKRKVALLTVLVPRVPLIILDEPTNTLDPTMRETFLEQLLLAKVAGKAVLFSSHVLQEVEAVCDRVVILKEGRVAHEERLDDLKDARQVRVTLTGPPPEPGSLPAGVEGVVSVGSELTLAQRGPLEPVLKWLATQAVRDVRIEPQGLGPAYRRVHGQPASTESPT